MSDVAAGLSAEDAKLVTLARGARGRIGAAQGCAVRDETGRTYSAATVALPSLELSAVQLAVATAAAAGARGLECVVVVGGDGPAPDDLAAVADLSGLGVGPAAPVIVCAPDGTVSRRIAP